MAIEPSKLTELKQQVYEPVSCLTGVQVGILYNFAPAKAQIERYYLSANSPTMIAF